MVILFIRFLATKCNNWARKKLKILKTFQVTLIAISKILHVYAFVANIKTLLWIFYLLIDVVKICYCQSKLRISEKCVMSAISIVQVYRCFLIKLNLVRQNMYWLVFIESHFVLDIEITYTRLRNGSAWIRKYAQINVSFWYAIRKEFMKVIFVQLSNNSLGINYYPRDSLMRPAYFMSL